MPINMVLRICFFETKPPYQIVIAELVALLSAQLVFPSLYPGCSGKNNS